MNDATTTRSAWHLRQGLTWLAVGLCVLLAVRLAALAFNRTDLFFDEAQYWSWSREPAFGYYSKPPLIAWLISLSTSLCGQSEFCVRLPSPIIHSLTAIAVFALATRLYCWRIGVLAALAFATLPGVSLSAGIMSTDVPLLLCWAVALFAFTALLDDREAWWPALLLGVALGLGLNAKYAMAYFVLCAGLYIAVTPPARVVVRDPRLWLALVLGVAMIVPNLAWNAANGFATFSHTADNANWSGPLFRPHKALEFLAAQFGVFGPILFAVLLIAIWRWWRGRLDARDRLLLAFALPIIVIVTAQAFISRAHANWAAPAYVSATVLVVAMLVREGRHWLTASYGISATVIVALAIAVAFAGQFALPGGRDPFARTLGWQALAEATQARLDRARREGHPFAAVITDERATTAELLYYLRKEPTPVLAWTGGRARARDHYELTRPFKPSTKEPVLLVALHAASKQITRHFTSVEPLNTVNVPAGTTARRVRYYRLAGFKGF